MDAKVNVSHALWPISAFDRRRRIALYGKSLGDVLDTAGRYGDVLAEEVAVAIGRSPRRGRRLIWLGHLLGWGGLALCVAGFATLARPDLDSLVFGPFGIGLLMQLPSGALVRAGRRELRPTEEELSVVDKRRPVVLLRAAKGDDDVSFLETSLRPSFLRFGPLVDSSRLSPTWGEGDIRAELARQMDKAVMVVLAPSDTRNAGEDVGWEIETVAKRKLGHKLLVLLPTGDGDDKAAWWSSLRGALTTIAGLESLPGEKPKGLIAIHLTSQGEPALVVGRRAADRIEYERAVEAAIYGMKCHARW